MIRVFGRIAAASAKEKHWRAKKAELDYKRAASELVDAKEISARFVELITTSRTKLLGLPSKAKAQLPHLTIDDLNMLDAIVREDKMWPGLCATIERPDLVDDPRFITVEARRKRSDELAAILREAFAARDYEHWRQAMAAHGITFGVISRPQDIPGDEQARACGAVVDTAIPEMPRTLANPIKLGFAEPRIANPAPALGQHTDQILAEAGLSESEIASLRQSGAVQ